MISNQTFRRAFRAQLTLALGSFVAAACVSQAVPALPRGATEIMAGSRQGVRGPLSKRPGSGGGL